MNDEQRMIMESAVRDMLQPLSGYLQDEVLEKTPGRVAGVLAELTAGYYKNADEVINNAFYPSEGNDMVLVRNVRYSSICEHHLIPFLGEVYVAYTPNGKVIGLSKVPRIVNMYARRLQIQERMTAQIAQLLFERLAARGVAVLTTGLHLCALIRGVKNCSVNLVSTAFLGEFYENYDLQRKFLELISSPVLTWGNFLKEEI